VEIRQYGTKTRWIVRVCQSEDLASVESRFGALAASQQSDGTFVIEDPEYGTVRFHPDGSVEAEGRTIARAYYSVKGDAEMLTPSS
jgi:hypothetical protein